MKRATQWAVCVAIISILMHHSLLAQSKAARPVGCKQCHECEIPTKLNPCLKKCPRDRMVTAHPSADSGPAIVTLNSLTGTPDVYEPVKFDHRGHAHMSDMSGGCAQCHHYNLTGDVLACKACHAVGASSKNVDLSKPNLKGAYHRQCVNCHRESGLETTCDGVCHRPKSANSAAVAEARPEKAAVHVMKPDRLVFESANADAKTVTFYHSDHTERFGLACSSCHTNERCSTCHRSDAASAKPLNHLEGGHDRCSTCHTVTENCEKCHGTTPSRGSTMHKRQNLISEGSIPHSHAAAATRTELNTKDSLQHARLVMRAGNQVRSIMQ
jgi:hypothetical protein